MTVSPELREQVRSRAGYACEYCGVAEADVGGELTIDHFQPQSLGGNDDLSNLIYCCHRCNLYKADYWPDSVKSPILWNPRREPREKHFLKLADGRLYPLTSLGTFTLNRLRLNRPPLIAYRLRRQLEADVAHRLARFQEIAILLEKLYRQQAELLEEHHALLDEQRTLLRLLLEE